MKRRTAKWLMVLVLILTVVVGYVVGTYTNGDQTALWIICIAGCLLSLIPSYFLRCPKCGKGQRKEWLFAKHCPHCGANLSDE